MIRAAMRIGAKLGFELKGEDGAVDLAAGGLAGKRRILDIGRLGVAPAVWAHPLKGFASFLQFLHLLRAALAALLLHLENRIYRPRMSDERPRAGAPQRRFRVCLHL